MPVLSFPPLFIFRKLDYAFVGIIHPTTPKWKSVQLVYAIGDRFALRTFTLTLALSHQGRGIFVEIATPSARNDEKEGYFNEILRYAQNDRGAEGSQ